MLLEASWNVMAHAQKTDFVFRRNVRVHLNQRWASVQSNTGSRVVRIGGINAGYTMFRGSVKGIGYPHHSPFSSSFPLPCITLCHHISTGVYDSVFLNCWRKTCVPLWRLCRMAIFAGLLSQFYFCTLLGTVSARSLCWTLFQNINEFVRRATEWYFYRV